MNNMRRWFSFFLLIGGFAGSGFLITALICNSAAGQNREKPQAATRAAPHLSPEDDAFLDDLSRRSFQFFWDASDPNTGITREHLYWDGSPYPAEIRDVGSTGATGFGITALCIGAEHGWVPRDKARQRALNTLRYYADRAPVEHGWFYHWLNVIKGERTGATFDTAVLPLPPGRKMGRPKSEVSVSDSTWLVAGALTAAQYFREEPEMSRLARKIYERVDYAWMRNGDPYTMSHGWLPETGFIAARYDKYCQLALMYLMGIGSPTHPLPPESWYAWERPPNSYGGYKYIGVSLLWTYQYPYAWADFRGRREKREPHTDWFANAQTATRAHRIFCIDLKKEFPGYSEDIWGITSSTSKSGYKAWGGPPRRSSIDGSVVPCAATGSLMLTPDISIPALRAMKKQYGDKIWNQYGFADAFNPNTGWVSPEVIGLDAGITLLSAENLRTGNVWRWFMRNPQIVHAMELAGLQ
jgi:hypothetical protein